MLSCAALKFSFVWYESMKVVSSQASVCLKFDLSCRGSRLAMGLSANYLKNEGHLLCVNLSFTLQKLTVDVSYSCITKSEFCTSRKLLNVHVTSA